MGAHQFANGTKVGVNVADLDETASGYNLNLVVENPMFPGVHFYLSTDDDSNAANRAGLEKIADKTIDSRTKHTTEIESLEQMPQFNTAGQGQDR